MVDKSEKRQIERALVKKQRDYAKKYRVENEKIGRAALKLFRDGETEEKVFPVICERFGCTKRRIRNILNRMSGSTSPAARAFNEAQLMLAYERLTGDLGLAKQEYLDQLEEIDHLETQGKDRIPVKFSDSDREARVESISLSEARNRALELLLDTHTRLWNTLGKVLPRTFNITHTNLTDLSDEELQALDEEVTEKETDLRIRQQ